jgi:hypothetical protein
LNAVVGEFHDPFEKRLGFNALGHDEGHGELFVVELAVTLVLVKRRGRNLAADFVTEFWIGSLIQPLLGGGFG